MEKMRKSVATSEDFLSGTIKTFEKTKPLDSQAVGIHTIQLFNKKTGVLEKELKSENFIGIVWDEIQKAIAKQAFMTNYFSWGSSYGLGLNGSSASLLLTTNASYEKLMGIPFNNGLGFLTPFANILLTNDVSIESPLTERLWKGEVLGYALRETTYSGSSTKQGSFNNVESLLENKHIKFVWDFPTHASNGTINSLVWSEDIAKNGLSPTPEKMFELTAPNGYKFSPNRRGSKLKGNILYVNLEPVGETYKSAIAKYIVDLETKVATFDSVVKFDSPYGLTIRANYDFDIDESTGEYYIAWYNSVVYRYPATGGAFINFPNALVGLNGGYYIGIKDGILYHASSTLHSRVVLATGEKHAPDQTITEFNPASRIAFIDGVGIIITGSSDAYIYDDVTNGLYKTPNCLAPIAMVNSLSSAIYAMYRGNDGDIGALHSPYEEWSGDKKTIYRTKFGRVGGRNLLPEPITKTADYTMKVTYDLYFE